SGARAGTRRACGDRPLRHGFSHPARPVRPGVRCGGQEPLHPEQAPAGPRRLLHSRRAGPARRECLPGLDGRPTQGAARALPAPLHQPCRRGAFPQHGRSGHVAAADRSRGGLRCDGGGPPLRGNGREDRECGGTDDLRIRSMLHADCPPPGKTTRIRCTGPATFLTSTVRWTYLATAATFAPHRSACLPRRDGPALGMPRSLLFTFLRRMLLWTLVGLVLAIGALVVLLQQPVFGATAQGERLERIHASPNFRNGAFQNRRFTPQLAEGYTMPGLLWEFIFSDPPRRMPTGAIPTQKHDLHALPPGDLLVWFGH